MNSLITTRAALMILSVSMICSTGFSQGVSINEDGSTPDPSAILELKSSGQGFLPPRLTTSERNAIAAPAEGLLIFNTDCKNIDIYVNNAWTPLNPSSLTPAAPTAGSHSSTSGSITWNWNAVSGATGYKYNTVNDFNTAANNGNSTTWTQTGLAASTSYTLYVWALSNCGNSPSVALNFSTLSFTCGVGTVSFTYNGSPVTYGTVAGQNGTCWLDRNLGASQVATSYNDPAALGDLFQWGRGADGHHRRDIVVSTTTTLSSTDVPGHSDFILTSADPNDWRSPQNNTLWQGVNGINNPCPAGWRLPTETEINNERASWPQNNYNGGFASPLKWTAGGLRRRTSGSIDEIGNFGIYYTSSTNGTFSRSLTFYSSGALTNNTSRGDAHSVRCVLN
jgi:hypothetical protein